MRRAHVIVPVLALLVGCTGAEEPTEAAQVQEPAPKQSANATQPDKVDYGTAYRAWVTVSLPECEVGEGSRVWAAPIARVLKHLPYAIKGHDVDDPVVKALLEADGDWYALKANPEPIRPEDEACVKQLEAREAVLAKEMPIPEPYATRIATDPAQFKVLWEVWLAAGEEHLNAVIEDTPERWRFIADRPHDPTSGAEPTFLYIECTPEEGCRVDFPLEEARAKVMALGSKVYRGGMPIEEEAAPE